MAIERVRYLDGWRGAAIISVLVGHFLGVPFINMGRVGVVLFFVLSGRLMAEILFIRRTPLGSFYLRRFSRIYPALLFFIASTFMLALAAHLFLGKALLIDPLNALASIMLVANYYHAYGHNTAIYGHIWSLCIEEHAYLFLGLVALIVSTHRRFRPATIAAVGSAAMMLNGVIMTMLGYDYYQTYRRTDVGAAAILASVAVYLWTRDRKFSSVTPLAALAIGIVVNFDVFPDPIKYTIGTLSLALAVSTLEYSPEALKGALSTRFMTWFGTLSYSIYLWQQPFYKINEKLPPYMTPILLVGVLVASLLSFYLVEQPARRFINGLSSARGIWQKRRSAPTAP